MHYLISRHGFARFGLTALSLAGPARQAAARWRVALATGFTRGLKQSPPEQAPLLPQGLSERVSLEYRASILADP